jgi:predicted HTH domain antitoxin
MRRPHFLPSLAQFLTWTAALADGIMAYGEIGSLCVGLLFDGRTRDGEIWKFTQLLTNNHGVASRSAWPGRVGLEIGFSREVVTMEAAAECSLGKGANAMQTVTMELPEDVFSALRRSPDEFAREMRLAAAILWYSRGEVSQEKAARIAGLDRADFLAALAQRQIEVFAVDVQSLEEELKRGARRVGGFGVGACPSGK